jgi:hypothetical protein
MDYQWGFTDDIANLDTPKYRALDALNGRPPAALTYGTLVPATLNAGRWSISSGAGQPGDGPIVLKSVATGMDSHSADWTAYTIRTEGAPSLYQLSMTYSADQDAELRTFMDGSPLEVSFLGSTAGSERRTTPLTFRLNAGLHSIRIQSARGEIKVRSIQVDAATPATPVLTPTPAAAEMPAATPTAMPTVVAVQTPLPVEDGQPDAVPTDAAP